MNSAELLRRYADILKETTTPDGGGSVGSQDFRNIINDTDQASPSPVGSIANRTEQEIRQKEREHHIRVGSPEWFKLYSKPFIYGEKPVGDAPAPRVLRDQNRHLD